MLNNVVKTHELHHRGFLCVFSDADCVRSLVRSHTLA